ncbi:MULTISPECIES: dTMP kinase [Methylobacterium]|uniref:Thymidylate kinase n=2 Tax=Pseudomonadota TaxID=1224 RepID=A0ABQ4SRS0_9HYPH|nr:MULTISPECIES: dTMP kinase [Methylobacterium]PIU08573.1 MAG: dTMP kinase [Methylobacterium sp. CG09_land_8_20_14_0_10_71_15]PIU11376.1 MAG: dTMP kinase [Methylobacterium sp. CG08_land_8_20_14_0_20_71_15]GBU19113.1 thymidylate kinase [Methylobacterium sp.]GJE05787.1 Thymidylate kinase [Methylobacterium jeotgali]
MRGRLVTFEGGEGVGKSTQVERLARTLRAAGREVVATREPGGTERAEAIRAALLSGAAKPYGPFAEALLFSAARIDHLDRLIRPALERGAVVLCDRFSDSTRAYQGAAGGLDAGTIAALERVTLGGLSPDLTLILDLPPETGLARARARAADTGGEGAEADRFEAEALAFHARLREAFLAIAAAEPARCAVIDAGLPPDAVEAAVREAVADRLPALLALGETRNPGEVRNNAA